MNLFFVMLFTSILFTGVVMSMVIIDSQAFAEEQIPQWIKNNFVWYADEIISENELLNSLKFLIENKIILIDLEDIDIPDRSKFADYGVVPKRSSEIPVVDYTVLVYVVGSDLESKYQLATADFKEMIQGNPGDSVNVIIESGGSKATPSGERIIDFTTVKRLKVSGDGLDELDDLGDKNMGVSSTLSDFIVWGTTSYPAEKYVLVLWNHGNGINGYGIDELNRDHLDLDELEDAFSDAKKQTDVNFEIIGFDACLMATLEVANVLKDYGNYMVASEEFEVGYGWDYNVVISSINENPTQTGDKLGVVIADAFFADTVAKSSPKQDLSRITTLSVIDLNMIPTLNDSVNALTANIKETISEEDMPKFSISLGKAERYGIVKGKDSGHMDIKSFAENIPKLVPQFKELSDKVRDDVDNAIVYKVHGDSRPDANGISLYMPLTSDAVATNYRYGDVSSVNLFYSDYLERDKITPSQHLTQTDKLISGTYDGDDVYEITIYFTTGLDDSGLVKIISSDEFWPYDEQWGFSYGQINYDWDGEIPSICDEDKCIPIYAEYEWGDKVNLAYIPVLIKNDQGTIQADLLYDITNVYGEILIGAYPNSEEGVFEKNLITLQNGDEIFPYIEVNHWDTDTFMMVPEDSHSIIVTDKFFNSGFWQKYKDPVELVIEVCDYSGNCTWSDFFEMNADGKYPLFN